MDAGDTPMLPKLLDQISPDHVIASIIADDALRWPTRWRAVSGRCGGAAKTIVARRSQVLPDPAAQFEPDHRVVRKT